MKRNEIGLLERLHGFLPSRVLELVEEAVKLAGANSVELFLVGGVVRDLLLDRKCLDLDIVVEGDAIGLVRGITCALETVVTHTHFRTATVKGKDFNLDFTTARRESYARPGALPRIQPGSITDDLLRRDFSINAMAIHLSGKRRGKLLDPCGGIDDLDKGVVRVLHEGNFIDDATRILRAIRYEQRFGFQLEGSTERLLKRDIPYLNTISGDRLRHELDRTFHEEYPEKSITRAAEMGVLTLLNPSLKGNGWIVEAFHQVRKHVQSPALPIYYALLLYRLNSLELEQVIARLNLSRALINTLQDTIILRNQLELLTSRNLQASQVYSLLKGYSYRSIQANIVACDDPVAQNWMRLFLDKLRYVRPSLKGDDLIRIGVASGPQLGELISRLRDARLDGKL
ncbi:CCA tRNA nucleotidyltransferase, partial [Chloroflexota bacterium]